MIYPCFRPALLGFALAFSLAAAAPDIALEVDLSRPGARLNPAMWGVFFEDINFGADGGLYGELLKNRSFEFDRPMMGWSEIRPIGCGASLTFAKVQPLHASNPRYLRVTVRPSDAGFGLANDGFRGIGVRQGERYDFSLFARAVAGGPMALRLELCDANDQPIGQTRLKGFGPEWKKHSASLTATATAAKARLKIRFEGTGTVDLDMISLFPRKTWKNRPGGLRADLAQTLADLKPGFVRFPGGCIVEGFDLSKRYQWKTTIGQPEERKLIINRWNNEFKHRPTPDYFQSFGLGFYEYFLFCEDIGAEPLPILNCGMACQFNSNELAPLDQLDWYLQDMLDLIEFANGPTDSVWGARRAAMGHAKPFNMKLLGIGNEQWGPQYIERYAILARALKEKHPEIQLVSSAGPDPDGEKFNFLWPKLRELKADLVDEHYYRPPAWFLDNAHRYDHYNRNDPKIFAGEYAAQSVRTVSPDNRNNWECALAEAAFMTGLERNADLVRMASYAPLSAHVDAWQWRPNLIWFDNLRVMGTPNYYVQQAFTRNRGDRVLPVQLSLAPARVYASATLDESAREAIIKLVNATAEKQPAKVQFNGGKLAKSTGTVTVLAGELQDENSLDQPAKIAPKTAKLTGVSPAFVYEMPPLSMSILRVPVRSRPAGK